MKYTELEDPLLQDFECNTEMDNFDVSGNPG